MHLRARTHHDKTVALLSEHPDPLQAYTIILPPAPATPVPEQRTQEGHEWLCVLRGQLRLVQSERTQLRTGDARSATGAHATTSGRARDPVGGR